MYHQQEMNEAFPFAASILAIALKTVSETTMQQDIVRRSCCPLVQAKKEPTATPSAA